MKYVILLLLIINIQTHAKEWRINWQHSKIGFQIGYMGLSTVDGSFNTYDGAFEYNQETNSLENIEVVIKTKSIDTDNNKRDQHLIKEDFFHTTKYPQITFKSTKVIYKDSKPVKVEGLLTIKKIKKSVILDLLIKGIVNDPWDNEKKSLFLSASTSIKRSDFNITWNKAMDNGNLILSDKVQINLEIEAFESGVRPAFSRFYLPINKIKKSVQNEVLIKQAPSTSKKDLKKKVVTSNIVKETNTTKGMVYTIIFGFILFLLMIVGAIKLQLWMTKTLENLKVNDSLTFIIPNLIIIIVLTILAIGFAPYMGYGTHPWQ
jgi:polyisoprenoid-binding protein YceI